MAAMDVLSSVDWGVIGLYFLAVFAVAIWSARRETTRQTSAGYFLAGRNTGWFVVGASLFASNIGSEHLVGLAGSGFQGGVAVGHFEVLAALVLMLLAWVFVPFYVSSGVYTMPEFLERRYGPASRWYLAVISIVGYVLTKISVTVFAGGIVLEALGIDFWTGAIVLVIATGIYTIFGGLRAVLFTDMFQAFVLLGGAAAITLIGLDRAGGWDVMWRTAGEGHMNMWKPADDPGLPWTGVLLGAPLLGIWYWCTDQFIVQRVLSAKNIDEARRGALFAGLLKLLPIFIMVIPGVIALVLVKQNKLEVTDPNQTLAAMITALLPAGVRGLVVAGVLAALMSSLSSVFNSCSTLVTWDIYRKLRPGASERQLVLVGQIATAAMVVAGLLWIPFMRYISEQLYIYLQSVQAYIAPPITAVFLLGLLWPRVNGTGAIASLLTGFVLGLARLVGELNKDAFVGTPVELFVTMNFLHFAAALFALCAGVLVVVSYLTPPEPREQLEGLTFATTDMSTLEGGERKTRPLWQRPSVWMSLAVLAGVAVIWTWFTG